MRLRDAKVQVLIGVSIALISSSSFGIFNLYEEVQENSRHRHDTKGFEDDIKELKSDVHELRKDVCWVKSHLRGDKIPDCNID